ncbi:CRISPR-associated protein Cas5 [Skermanella aerolata KACC 11604]|nr:CRISPR-associated protein Cas5 [Skermanella aerolata KACC 11604]
MLLLLDAPLMAFGVPVIDQNGVTGRFPGVAQVAGLLGNALGWRHADTAPLQRLQERVRLAAAIMRNGTPMRDFQTVDLSQPHLVGTGWTTRGRRQDRGGGEATSGTHIRYRWYRAGEAIMVALRLDAPEERPTLADLEAALDEPFRPLFIGRKACLPAAPLLVRRCRAASLADALALGVAERQATMRKAGVHGPEAPEFTDAEWPEDEPGFPTTGDNFDRGVVYDRRDWRNQLHGGERRVRRGRIRLKEPQP